MKPIHLFLLVMLTALAACETLVTDIPLKDLPPTTSKLAVNSYISPQAAKTIVVVTESIPLYGESTSDEKIITNAVVKISDGVKEAVMPYDTAAKVYSLTQAQFPIKASQTYKLVVSDGKRTVDGTCTVPASQVTIQSRIIDTTYTHDLNGRDTAITLKMNWLDIPNEKNFYRMRGYIEVEYSVAQMNANKEPVEKRVKGRFNFEWDENTGRSNYQNDSNLDGTVFTSPLGKAYLPTSILYSNANGPVYAKQKVRLILLNMEVLNTDQAYYDYHRSLDLNRNSNNPFAEPVLIYSNINGGLGCFAAYNSRQIVYRP
jgi:hypothetical protein